MLDIVSHVQKGITNFLFFFARSYFWLISKVPKLVVMMLISSGNVFLVPPLPTDWYSECCRPKIITDHISGKNESYFGSTGSQGHKMTLDFACWMPFLHQTPEYMLASKHQIQIWWRIILDPWSHSTHAAQPKSPSKLAISNVLLVQQNPLVHPGWKRQYYILVNEWKIRLLKGRSCPVRSRLVE